MLLITIKFIFFLWLFFQNYGAADNFESVEMGEPIDEGGRVRVPRRTIFFASGETMEEYSTDEEEDEETPMKKDVVTVDPVGRFQN